MRKKILIIDDDPKLIALLTQYLTQYEFDVISAGRPKDGLRLITESKPNLVILDLMLPEMNGLDVCKAIRIQNQIPIVMLTARGDVADKVVGLELGADDYLSKPFEPRELLARIQSVLRRTERKEVSKTEPVSFGPLTLDFSKRQATLDGVILELTTMEFEVLGLFASNVGVVLTRDQVMDTLRGIEWEAYNRSIDVLISRLRHKLKDDPKNPRFIKTVWGSGYLFVGG